MKKVTYSLHISKFGAPGESRTPKIMILNHTRMPVPSPGLKRKMLHVSIAFFIKNSSS